jgi:hypothetical protein
VAGDQLTLVLWARGGFRAPIDEKEILAHGGCLVIALANCNQGIEVFKVRQEPCAYQLNMDGAFDLRLPVFLRSAIGGTGFGRTRRTEQGYLGR